MRSFQVHPRLTEQGLEQALKVELAFDECFNKLCDLLPGGREAALVQTKLQEASFFAFRAVASMPGGTVDS